MPGIIKVDQIRSPQGTNGFRFNTTTKQVEQIAPGDFYLQIDGETFTPNNKVFMAFYYNEAQTGSYDQTWTVPTGVTHIFCKLWGSGGGGGCQGGWNHGGRGGGGGHTRGLIPVSSGQTVTIRVPRGGNNQPGTTNAPFGGGSSTAGGDNQYCGGGGGYASVLVAGTVYLVAGGGGGGGSTTSGGFNHEQHGGAGGGTTGQTGYDFNTLSEAGRPGTQSAGGAGGTGGNTTGQAGSAFQGGSANGNPYGAGGGGGYYGGGAGSYGGAGNMGGGGGGSGYVHSSVLLGGTYSGAYDKPAFHWDNDLPKHKSTYTEFAVGGDYCNPGGDGFVCIYY